MARVLKELISPATSTCTKIQLTLGERRGQGSVGDGMKGEIRVMTYLH